MATGPLIGDNKPRVFPIANFVGGIAKGQATDSECEVLENFEIQRNGFLHARGAVGRINNNSLGSGMIVGLDIVAANNTQQLVVAKANSTTWYYTATALTSTDAYVPYNGLPAAYTFSSFTTPSNPGDDRVKMESVVDSSGANWGVFCNPNITRLMQWNGTGNPTTMADVNAPQCKYLRWFGDHLYAAGITGSPFVIQFSDSGDPFTWPSTNQFAIPASHGPITGLERQPSMLLIFCERGILALQGDPPLNYVVTVLHDGIGCGLPHTISTLGSATAFCNFGQAYILSGTIKTMTDKIGRRSFYAMRGPSGTQVTDPTAVGGCLLAANYMVFCNNNNSVATPKVATNASVTDPVTILPYDRLNFQLWGTWTFTPSGTTAGFGYQHPYQSCVCRESMEGILLGGADGNIYRKGMNLQYEAMQYDRTLGAHLPDASPTTTSTVSTWTPGVSFSNQDQTNAPGTSFAGQNIVSIYRSRIYYIGDPCLQKQFKKIYVSGVSGENVYCNVNLFKQVRINAAAAPGANDEAYSYTRIPVKVNGTIPFQADIQSLITSTEGYNTFTGIQVELQVVRPEIQGIDIMWTPQRFSLVNKLPAINN